MGPHAAIVFSMCSWHYSRSTSFPEGRGQSVYGLPRGFIGEEPAAGKSLTAACIHLLNNGNRGGYNAKTLARTKHGANGVEPA